MVFTGIMSAVILKRKLSRRQWIAIVTILFGVAIVGSTPILMPAEDQESDSAVNVARQPLVGVLLILCGQWLNAVQFVIEEKILMRYKVPPIKMCVIYIETYDQPGWDSKELLVLCGLCWLRPSCIFNGEDQPGVRWIS